MESKGMNSRKDMASNRVANQTWVNRGEINKLKSASGGGGALGYKEYVAILTDVADGSPIPIELSNTIGTPIQMLWDVSNSIYTISAVNGSPIFPLNKTLIILTPEQSVDTSRYLTVDGFTGTRDATIIPIQVSEGYDDLGYYAEGQIHVLIRVYD